MATSQLFQQPGTRLIARQSGVVIVNTIAVWMLLVYAGRIRSAATATVLFVALAFVLLPLWLRSRRRETALRAEATQLFEEAERLRLELDTLRYRTVRLREDLAAAHSQARQSHQLTLLGRFTAGFLHEFNNPLAILTSRIEVLLDERKEDAALCVDLNQMLREARYMAKISGTLLPALRRERGAQTFSPCLPAEVLREIMASLAPAAAARGVRIILEPADAPPVNLPEHVLEECLRVLISNALDALAGRSDASVWMRVGEFHNPGAQVLVHVDDNGPGVPEDLQDHLFEPFTSRSAGRERLGLGLFVAASLLDTYDGSLAYERAAEGGARFTLALPASRFTKEQPYHWFVEAAPA